MIVDKRVAGIPVTFVVVVVMVIILTIFFGAWAVSADVEGRDKSLAFGIISGSGNSGALDPTTSSESNTGLPSDEDNDGASDTWWGKSLLKACPVH